MFFSYGLDDWSKVVASYEYKCEKDSSTQTIQRGMTQDEIIPYCDICNNLTDEEMQKLQEQIIEGIEDYFESYDWDKAFKKYLEGQ